MIRRHVARAIFKRDFSAYFRSPTGYVFITLFILLGAVGAFWQERFFSNNLATLETLNGVFPLLLLFFIPAVTMGAWAPEKQEGTEELLLTLPVSDAEVVVGKYLACLGIYSVALGFSLSHVAVLAWLGSPDLGLMAATYLGYWLLGAVLIGVGMIGSMLTSHLTVGFVLGSLGSSIVVFIHQLAYLLPDRPSRLLGEVSPVPLFRQLAAGVVAPQLLLQFLCLVVIALYINWVLLGRRRWAAISGEWPGVQRSLRTASLVVIGSSLTVLASRPAVRADLTAERLHSLSKETRALLRQLQPDKPVYVQAFVSPEVPQEYVQARTALLELLAEYDAVGGDVVVVNIRETERFGAAAREAAEQFGIRPQGVVSSRGGRSRQEEIFLGLAVTCGIQEVVIPFLHKGIPVEYELTRSISVASRPERVKLGVLTTDAKIIGGFDFKSMTTTRRWAIVEELQKQYDVVPVDADAEYPADLKVVLAGQPSSLTQPQLDRLADAVQGGLPALLFDDPLPLVDTALVPGEPKGGRGLNLQQQMGGGMPPRGEKGDIAGFYRKLGLRWPSDEVVWDTYNPHPALAHLPKEVVFVGSQSGAAAPFHASDPVASGLQEMVLLFPGHWEAAKGAKVTVEPLLTGTKKGGVSKINEVMMLGFFGFVGMNPRRPYKPDKADHALAVHVRGVEPRKNGGPLMHYVAVADLDVISEEFFEIRKQKVMDLEFDNIPFVLNAVDVLAGDDAFVALRKRRRRHRTLEAVEAQVQVHADRSLQVTKEAEDQASAKLKEAQDALAAKVEALRKRRDLDERTQAIMVASLEEVENRRLEVTRANIEDEKQRTIEQSQMDMELAVKGIHQDITWMAVSLPPIPPLLLGLWMFLRKRRREREIIPRERFVAGGA